METSRLSYTPVTDYMAMPIDDFIAFRLALVRILEREKTARDEE